ncbi:hypothetical protein MP228_013173 [Amoeboaphelidium protococcarum]|nr:hypothetical protein MP228_013173 [Amoeboaphelidium protococcarum]
MQKLLLRLLLVLLVLLFNTVVSTSSSQVQVNARQGLSRNVTYDHRALKINGKRQMLMVATIHYPRSLPSQWRSLLRKIRQAGNNAIDTYVFWDLHEPERGQYRFTPNTNEDLRLFIRIAQEEDLYVILRYGPYVCAEWSYGGFPVWLREIPGMEFRTYNEPFMRESARFLDYFVEYTQDLFFHNGGPIVMLQVENEYGMVENEYGADGSKYINWIADYALNMKTELPWIVCQQNNIPQLINTCNGFYCDSWQSKDRPYKDSVGMFTENWTGWFLAWEGVKPLRPAEDLAFSVARFIAKGGTYNAYYMWHGGTNFGRTVGVGLVTSYDYDAPMDEYGFPAEPKYSHLKQMHEVLFKFESVIVNQDEIVSLKLDGGVEVEVYGDFEHSEQSIAFLSNVDEKKDLEVEFHGQLYKVPKWSVTFVQGPRTNPKVLYNTATMGVPQSKHVYTNVFNVQQDGKVQIADEPIGVREGFQLSTAPREQISFTRDKTDYLWYSKDVSVPAGTKSLHLNISRVQDHVIVYLNDTFAGVSRGNDESVELNLRFTPSDKDLVFSLNILTQTLGLTNFGAHRENWSRGIVGSVKLNGKDLTLGGWKHTAGLLGEERRYFDLFSSHSTDFIDTSVASLGSWQLKHKWIKVQLPLIASSSDSSTDYDEDFAYVLDLASIGKGQAWVNGHHIGRYWNITGQLPSQPTNPYPPVGLSGVNALLAYQSSSSAQIKVNADGSQSQLSSSCSYAGTFTPDKCRDQTLIGKPTQRYYHVPQDWLLSEKSDVTSTKQKFNEIVLFEEEGGNIGRVSLLKVRSKVVRDQLIFQ